MFNKSTALVFFIVFLTSQVMAGPVSVPREANSVHVVQRSLEALAVIPAEQPVKSPGGTVVPYPRRQVSQEGAVYARQIPAEVAVEARDGLIQPRQIPEEDAVKAPDGQIVPFRRRQIPAEVAVKAPDGFIVPF